MRCIISSLEECDFFGLALGGPEGQKLTITNETRKVKNKTHSQVTSLQRKIIRIIKNKMK